MSKEKNLIKIKKSKNSNTVFGLPAKSYVDEDFWKKECQTVLSNGWLFVGFAHELKKPGDVNPLFIANKPILLVRNNKNEITAFHNVCSHRCLKLVDEKKNVGKIISCPYHAWSYDLDGKLKSAPHVGGTNQHKPEGFNFPISLIIFDDKIALSIRSFPYISKSTSRAYHLIAQSTFHWSLQFPSKILDSNFLPLLSNIILEFFLSISKTGISNT